jgi:hypothetical protein
MERPQVAVIGSGFKSQTALFAEQTCNSEQVALPLWVLISGHILIDRATVKTDLANQPMESFITCPYAWSSVNAVPNLNVHMLKK